MKSSNVDTQPLLDFYKHPSGMTSPGKYEALVKKLPDDISQLTRIVQGLAIHEFVAQPFYGFEIPDNRKGESHIRSFEKLVDRILELDDRDLAKERPPEKRVVGVCHHFVLLLVGVLRAKGVPARGRCGFGSYFNPGFLEDHWVCEYWNSSQNRWALADPQFDDVWRKQLMIDHNTLDVPRDRFLVAADAWTECRSGKADPDKFGIFKGNLRGLWFIAGDLIRDVASLNEVEMLPWDVWGAMPKPNETLQDMQLAFFDILADLTRDPDSTFEELRRMYESDNRLRMPGTVFNATLNRPETVDL